MDDTKRGIYNKFIVKRADGGDEKGGKHENCFYFVLDVIHDPFAIPALLSYAEACKDGYPALYRDIMKLVGDYPAIDTPIERDAKSKFMALCEGLEIEKREELFGKTVKFIRAVGAKMAEDVLNLKAREATLREIVQFGGKDNGREPG